MILLQVGVSSVFRTQNIQGFTNFMFYAIIGLFSVILVGYIMFKLYQRMTYNYSVDFYRKVGDTQIQFLDKAKQVKLDGNYMFHYMGLGKYSPVIDSKYFRIRSYKQFGLFPKSQIHFSAYLLGESIFPIEVKDNPGLVPMNIDLFNYMQQRIRANALKYSRQNLLLQLAPIIGVGLVVVMFIVGMIFYTKHVENIAQLIISTAQKQAETIMEQGGVQVIQP